MKPREFFAAICAVANTALPSLARRGSAGCGKPLPENLSPGGPSANLTLQSKSQIGTTVQRRFLTYLPVNFSDKNDRATPLILAFHGQTQPTWSMESITNLSTPYFNKDAIVLYPEGLDYKYPGHQWLGDPEAPPSSIIDDRIFAEELLDYLTTHFCIDETRIYALGLSNGGGLTGLLACSPRLNRRIAAFATVSAAFYTDTSLTEPLFGAGCNPQLGQGRKLPMMDMHGLNDSIIHYDGINTPDPNTIPLPTWVSSWVEIEGCGNTKPEMETLEGGKTTKSSWSCSGWTDVFVHYKIGGFGHAWPATVWQGQPWETLRLRPTSWNATSVILDWFGRWRLERERDCDGQISRSRSKYSW